MATIPAATTASGEQVRDAADPDQTRKRALRNGLGYLVRYGLLLLYMVICLYPFIWMVATSLRDQRSVFTAGASLWVTTPNWPNYADIWDSANLPRAFVNTLAITAACMVLSILDDLDDVVRALALQLSRSAGDPVLPAHDAADSGRDADDSHVLRQPNLRTGRRWQGADGSGVGD